MTTKVRQHDEVRDLLEPASVSAADSALARLRELQDTAAADLADLRAGADATLLDDPEEADRLSGLADRKARECQRLELAISSVVSRREELIAADLQAEGRRKQKLSREKAALAMKIHLRIGEGCRQICDDIDDLAMLNGEIEALRSDIEAAGLICDALPPHRALFEPEQYESRRVLVEERAPSIKVDGQHNPPASGGELVDRRYRTERVRVSAGRQVPDFTRCALMIPHPDNARAWLVRRDQ
ncbi:hypothetical protein ASALC70_00032 [Alcanivorax sp. ALC70]|nr:hypothetical protein [Alcanivorax sp.]MBI56701.1 hypothetical protein [Alcanivorax sp.]UWN47859.1 hypothetical protein ASALC70_00032 [Alcanivorax sp. ALC70]|tara:strand:+ start:4597 stop:5325 length:729 start_codon:yes stop_codon:yes gene_type:complete